MKSFHSQSWDLTEGRTINNWKPDEIFPSLTSESVASSLDEILQLFPAAETHKAEIPEKKAPEGPTGSRKTQPVVETWNLDGLENISGADSTLSDRFPGLEGTPAKLVLDEKQRLIAEARHQADMILQNANNKARELLLAAKKDSEVLRQQAYEAGRVQALSELSQVTDNAQAIIDELKTWQKETIHDNELLLLEMVKKIARILFGKGYQVTAEVLQNNLDKVMRLADSLGDIRVYLNPDDSRILNPEWKNFQESLSGKHIQIIPSEEILPGGCYVQGEMGVLDARIETQLNSIFTSLDQEHEKTKDKS